MEQKYLDLLKFQIMSCIILERKNRPKYNFQRKYVLFIFISIKIHIINNLLTSSL